MKSVLSVISIVCLVGSELPVAGQEQPPKPGSVAQTIAPEATRLTAPSAESRFADARRVIHRGGGHVEEAKGVLVSDPQGRQVRFEVDDRAAFVVPYDRITTMHYEEAVESSTWRGRVTKYYLTIHYAVAGQATFETVRLSERDVPLALAALETDTGLTMNRTLAKQSFLGIPIRGAIGDRVTVTDQTGQTIKGTITQLSASSVMLAGSTGGPRIFGEASVKKIRLSYSPGHDALVGFGFGALFGGIGGGLIGGGLGGDASSAFEGAALMGAIVAGTSAGVAVAIGAALYPLDKGKDLYLGGASSASKTSAITIVPQVAKERRGVLVSVRF